MQPINTDRYWRSFAVSPRMPVSEWADQNRYLSPESSAEAGRWRTARAPYLKEILNALIPSDSKPIEVVVDESKVRDREVPELWGDPSKARKAVGWQPRFELQTTLRDLKLYWETVLRPSAQTSREHSHPQFDRT